MAEPMTRRELLGAFATASAFPAAAAENFDLKQDIGRHRVTESVNPGRVHLDVELPNVSGAAEMDKAIDGLMDEMQKRGISARSGHRGADVWVRDSNMSDPGAPASQGRAGRLATAGSMEYQDDGHIDHLVRQNSGLGRSFNRNPITDREKDFAAAENGYSRRRVISLNVDTNGRPAAEVVQEADRAYRALRGEEPQPTSLQPVAPGRAP